MLVFHFSKLILLIAHFSLRDLQKAEWTTAVAPTPKNQSNDSKCLINISIHPIAVAINSKAFDNQTSSIDEDKPVNRCQQTEIQVSILSY